MARVLEAVKRAISNETAAELAAEIARKKVEANTALDEAERQEAAAALADDFGSAERLSREAAAARWRAERIAKQFPELEARLALIKTKERQAAESQLRSEYRERTGAYIEAIRQLAKAARASVAFDTSACATLGEGRARVLFPPITYAGIVKAEFLDDWLARMEVLLAPPTPRKASRPTSAKAAVVPPKSFDGRPEGSLQHGIVAYAGHDVTALMTAKRVPDDTSSLLPGESRVRVLRAGYSPADDRPQAHFGQILKLPRKTAEAAAAAGVVEILENA